MWRRTRILQDLDQKIREHIEMATRDNIDSGMSAEPATRLCVSSETSPELR
jgi:hypothetical protein